MYLSLIDTVSKIVKTYGVDILSDPKFWHILSDSYSFGNEYSLKDTFKSCLSIGYVSKLIAIKGNSKKTKAEIAHIVDSENKLNTGKKKEYSAVLYSIAIAIGSCNKKDYSDFINRNNPQTAPKPKHKPKRPNSPSITFGVVFSTLVGLIILFAGTLFYGAYLYDGWWMFPVILLMGIIQIGYCAFCLNIFDNPYLKWNDETKRVAVYCYIPIICCFFINSLVPFFLCNESIRRTLYHHFSDDFNPSTLSGDENAFVGFERHLIEAPGFFSIVLTIIFAFCLFSCCLGLYSEKFSFTYPRYSISKRAMIIITCSCFCGYSMLFLAPSFKRYSQRETYIHEHNEWSAKNLEARKHNHELIESRKHMTPELSFKGIKLGISFETAQEYAKALSDFERNIYSHYSMCPKSHKSLANAYMGWKPKEDSDSIWLTGELIAGKSTIDNTSICLRILEKDNRVYSIVVVPEESENWNCPKGYFSNYKDLIELYKKKYGEPEIVYRDSHSSEHYFPTNDNISEYVWTFGNGAIRLSSDYIIYSPRAFELDVKRVNDILDKKERAEELEKQHRLHQIDSAKRAIIVDDSLRRINKHKNAINEI